MGAPIMQPSFAAGELSPSVRGRVDLARYQTGLARCRNCIVMPYGGVKNRAGTRYVGDAPDHDKRHRLIPFTFSTSQTYVLVFGDRKLRFVTDSGYVLSGSTIYEIVTPYAESDLPALKFAQTADAMTICHPDHAPKKLSRFAHDDWTLTDLALQNGPFQSINTDATATVYASAATGTSVTLTASSALFTSSHIGMAFYLEQLNYGKPWEAGKSVAVNDIRRANGKYYKALNAATTGTLRPSADNGTENDGAVEWQYLHPGFGSCTITAIGGGGTTATVNVENRLPDESVGSTTPTHKWAFGAFGGDQGYPACVAYHRQRQVFANTVQQPQTLWFSRIGAYTDFGMSNPVVDDDPITITLDSRQVNPIRHLLPMGELVVLTSGAEWLVSGENGVIAPSTIQAKTQGYRGAADMPPIIAGNTSLFVQDKGRVVRDIGYEFASDSYTGVDLSILASHLFDGLAVEEWAWQPSPYGVAWLVMSNGTLLGLTYLRDQQVIGWHRHDTEGTVESVCVVSEGSEDALYLMVARTINGETRRYVERMANRDVPNIVDAFHVDCGLTYNGDPAALMFGLNHLDGATVAILADGMVHPPRTVVDGAVTLDYTAAVVHIGLPFSAEIQTLDVANVGREATAGRIKRIAALRVLFEHTGAGVQVGPDSAHLSEQRSTVQAYDQAANAFDGVAEFRIAATWARQGQVLIRQDNPLPMHVLAVIPEVDLGGH